MGIRFDHNDIAANLTSDGYDFVSKFATQGGSADTVQTLCDGNATFTTIEGDGDGPDPDPTDPDDLRFDGIGNCWFHDTLGDHGLWTAGIIGAVGNEGIGIAGVNWSVKIRPVRVLGITGEGTDFDIAQGVLYAAGLPAIGADNGPRSSSIACADHQHESWRRLGQHHVCATPLRAASARGLADRRVGGQRWIGFPCISRGVSERHGGGVGRHGRRARDVLECRHVHFSCRAGR